MNPDIVSVKELLEAGVHFGHRRASWDPRMKPFIFGERDKIHIIDIQKTLEQIKEACKFAKEIAAKGELVLLVGTKKQARDTIKGEADRCQMPYVNNRWLGGTLTNFATIKSRIDRLLEMEKMEAEGAIQNFSKKEQARFQKNKQRLLRNLEGLKVLNRLPGLVFVIDSNREKTAISEARRLKIPVVSLLDTNCNPELVDYCIVGNDDAIKSVKAITTKITDAILEGQRIIPEPEEEKTASFSPAPETGEPE